MMILISRHHLIIVLGRKTHMYFGLLKCEGFIFFQSFQPLLETQTSQALPVPYTHSHGLIQKSKRGKVWTWPWRRDTFKNVRAEGNLQGETCPLTGKY